MAVDGAARCQTASMDRGLKAGAARSHVGFWSGVALHVPQRLLQRCSVPLLVSSGGRDAALLCAQ